MDSIDLVTETLSARNAKIPASTTPSTAKTQSVSQITTIIPILTTLPIPETQTDEKATNPTTDTISTTLPTIETQADRQATKPTSNTMPIIPPTTKTQIVGQVATSSSTIHTLTILLTDETQTQRLDNQTQTQPLLPVKPKWLTSLMPPQLALKARKSPVAAL